MDRLSNNFIDVQYDKQTGIMISSWKPTTENATWEEVKSGFSDYFLKMIKDQGPKYVIVDEREMHHAYSPEEQSWVDKNSAPVVLNSPVEKLAIVISHDGFVELATETMMEEDVSKGLNTRFFDSIEKAKEWFFE